VRGTTIDAMGLNRELVDLVAIAALGAFVVWIVRPSRRKKKIPSKSAQTGPAAWDPDTDAGRRKR
jgi:hypothetical protein